MSEAEANAPPAPEQPEQTPEDSNDGIDEKEEDSKIPKSKQMECAGYLLTFMELENEKDQKTEGDSDPPAAEGKDVEVTEGVAKMGV